MKNISIFTIQFNMPKELYIKGFNGRIAHGAFLQYLRKYDVLLSQDLHMGKEKRSYSLTPIEFIKTSSYYDGKFSVYTNDERIINAIMSLIIQNKYGDIYIVDTICKVTQIGFNRVEIPEPTAIKSGTIFWLNFNQPTYFSNSNRKSKSDAYPHLNKIWMDMLNTYSDLIEEINLSDKRMLADKLMDQLSTPRFKLESRHVIMSEHIKITCFKGSIMFKVEDASYIDLLIPILELAKLWGIGGKRSMGFGRVSVNFVEEKNKKDTILKKMEGGNIGERAISSN